MVNKTDSAFDAGPSARSFTAPTATNMLWLVGTRWIAGVILVVGIVGCAILGLSLRTGPLLTIVILVLVYNALVGRAVRSGRFKTPQIVRRAWMAQIFVDLVAITMFLYYCGGVASPLSVAYVLPVVTAGVFLRTRFAYLAGAVGSGLFGAMAVLQANVPALYNALPEGLMGQHFHRWPFVTVIVCVVAAALLIVAYLSTSLSARIRASEAEIIRSRDVLDSIITSMPEGLIFLAPEGRLVLANATATRWFGGNPGRNRPLVEGDLPPGLVGYIRNEKTERLPGTAGTFSFEMMVGSGEASRKFRAGASNVRDEAGRYLGNVVLIEDVTEQLKLEEDLRAHSRKILRMSETIERNREEMAQREKMVAIGTMAAGVAHEIGNPLAAISAVVQRMTASAEKTDAQAEQLQSIAGQIDRIVAIVRGMLTFARPANGQRSFADVDKLIEDTISIVRYSRHARSIRIESVRNMSLPKIEIMAQQFQQVLVNVLLNAFDAMEDSSREKVVGIKRGVTQGWIDIKVTDNGCGMTQQQIGQAFEPFYTTKVPGRGTGLGLAVSYSLVEQQGGHIRITSTPGRGTTVTILLPRDRGAARNAGATGKVARKSARSALERRS